MDEESTTEPYSAEAPTRASASNGSIAYAAAAMILPFLIFTILSIAPDSEVMNIAKLVVSVVTGGALVFMGFNLLKMQRRRNENRVFTIVGLVFSAAFTVFSVFLSLVVIFAILFILL